MNPTELRLGNFIDYEATTHIITSLGESTCNSKWLGYPKDTYLHSYSELKPIVLTEEWFLKFKGFYKDGQYISIDVADYKYCFKYRDWAENWALYQEYTDSPDPNDDGKKHPISFDYKYVHQLQNLYFALMGEELKMK